MKPQHQNKREVIAKTVSKDVVHSSCLNKAVFVHLSNLAARQTTKPLMHDKSSLAKMTAEMVSAYLSNHNVPAQDVPELIRSVHQAIASISNGDATANAGMSAAKPAVPVKRSVTDAYIICLEDGLKFKSLKRHLRSAYGMSPEDYRAKWQLPHDYPMVAPNYAEHRSQLAKQIGLGRQKTAKRR